MTTITVACPRCLRSHKIEPKPFSGAGGAYTHWYMCPNTNDPVMLYLVTDGKNSVKVNVETVQRLTVAQASNRWMAAIWWMEDGRVKLYRKTHNFPRDDFNTAIEALIKNIESENKPPEPEPLPERPSLNLFTQGDEKEDGE